MDPFSKLPQELRFNLLVSLGSLTEVAMAAWASRALLQQLQEFKGSIVHRYALRDGDLNGDVLQDALAIIKFPRSDATATNVDTQQRMAAIHGHLRKWGAKEFSDPFHPNTRDIPTMLDVHTLCRQMRLYIEDYLSKATSPCLPRAYRRLPPWSHPHFSRNPTQMLLLQDVNQFDADSLGHTDRRKILQAFLRYELLCKIYGLVAGKPDTQHDQEDDYDEDDDDWAGGDPPDGYQFEENNPFRYWDWSILYRYEKREPEDSELQLLPCVREYLLATYGALIADQVQAPIPIAVTRGHPEYENAPSSGSGRFPDYNPYNESEDLLSFGRYRLERYCISWHCNDYIRLHRQRAWALFDDSCQGPQIPPVDEYRRVYGPGPVGGLVGWGLEMDDTRNEWIAHGQGTMAYSSLIPKMVPVWETRVA
ncbi:hypothetical protein MRS44_006341 [Fusarium solani]|uniref:uncharacterized protein n=1 Tax=Fusarium solani TaxID=169388 RepID=UPI0032C3E3AB|nr:hypothetical protein MRS44_006341 [Fusarium solani]